MKDKKFQNEKSIQVSSPRFRSQYNYSPDSSFAMEPVNDLPSLTQPDLSYSVKDIISRFVRGIAPPVASDVYYPEIPDDADPFDYIDPTQRMDFDLSDYSSLRRDLDDRLASSVPTVSDPSSPSSSTEEVSPPSDVD